jgi:hypothetical protein
MSSKESTSSATEKQCFRCKKTKHINDFTRDRKYSDGHSLCCRVCDSEDRRRWRLHRGSDTMPPLPDLGLVQIRHCPGYLGYAVDDDGNVWSCRNKRRVGSALIYRQDWRKRKVSPDSGDYLSLTMIGDDGRRQTRMVHQLVLEAFVGPKPEGQECCHENGIRSDCHLLNLRYDTKGNNQKDSVSHGTHNTQRPSTHPNGKFSEDDIRMMRHLYNYLFAKQIASLYGVSIGYCKAILNHRERKDVS